MRDLTLIVDDDPLIRMQVADVLDSFGVATLQAGSARAALVLLAEEARICCVVTDIRMPGEMDGLALAALVAQRWPAIRVVVASGRSPEDVTLPAGAALLSKPFGMKALLAALDRSDLMLAEPAAS